MWLMVEDKEKSSPLSKKLVIFEERQNLQT
jgi:hypothetical protein